MRVRDLRKAQKLTQHQLADRAGVSQSTVSRIEKHGDTKIGEVYQVARALGTTLTALIAEVSPAPNLDLLLSADPGLRGAVIHLAENIRFTPTGELRMITRSIETFAEYIENDARNRNDYPPP